MSSITLAGADPDPDALRRGRCSIDAALEIVGRRASFLVLREAYYGTHRFEEFTRRAGFSEAVTATRLRELVDAGVLERRPYREPGRRRRHEYHLTDMGRDLFPVLVALRQWGDRWAQPDGAPVTFAHAGCGARIEAQVRCAAGHEVPYGEIEARTRPESG